MKHSILNRVTFVMVLVKVKRMNMKVEKVMTVYKHYTGLWVVLALVRVNGRRKTKRFTFDTEAEARAVKEGNTYL